MSCTPEWPLKLRKTGEKKIQIILQAWDQKSGLKMKYHKQLLFGFAAVGISVVIISK